MQWKHSSLITLSLLLFLYLLHTIQSQISFDITLIKSKDTTFPISNINYFKGYFFKTPTIKLCFGKPFPQCLNLAMSLSTSELVIERTKAKHPIFTNHYDMIKSSTYQETNCGLGWLLDGFMVNAHVLTDYISIDDHSISKSRAAFLLIYSTESISESKAYDGYVGLIKYKQRYKTFEAYDIIFPNFLFINYNLTKENMLIALNSKEEGGKLSFGITHDSGNTYDKCITEISSRNDTIERCYIDKITMNNHVFNINDNNNNNNNKELITFDIISNLIIAPISSGEFIFDTIITFSGGTCKRERNVNNALLLCNSLTFVKVFPDVHITMSNAELVFQWKNIFEYIEEKECYVSTLIYQYNNLNDWIVGVPGLIGNKIFFDFENMSIGTISLLDDHNKKRNGSGIIDISTWKHKMIYLLLWVFSIGILLSILYMFIIKKYIIKK